MMTWSDPWNGFPCSRIICEIEIVLESLEDCRRSCRYGSLMVIVPMTKIVLFAYLAQDYYF